MKNHLSQRINLLEESQTMAMNQKTRDLQSQGFDIINLTVGEPDFNTPDYVKEGAKSAVEKNYSFYTPVDGYPDLRKAIAEKFATENHLEYAPEQISVGNGAKHSLSNILCCLVDNEDEVIVPAPYWVSYVELVKLYGGKNVIIDTSIDNGFKITPQQLESAITPKTKLLILCSPSNPTGACYSKKELESLAKVLEKHPNIFVLSDEIYEHINFVGKHESIAQFPLLKERTIIINGVSKCYAMTGYRIGYLAAPLWLTKAISKLQGQQTSNASSIAQRAAFVALTQKSTFKEDMRKIFLRRRELMVKGLESIKGVRFMIPDGAFYVFPDISSFFGKTDGVTTIKNDMDMCLYLLDKALVSTVPGGAFGNPNCIRLSYATSDEKLSKALNQIKESLDKLH